jgi:hypothetical protein
MLGVATVVATVEGVIMWTDVDVDPNDVQAMAKLIDDGTIQPVQAVEMILDSRFTDADGCLLDLARHIVNVLQY